MGAEDTLISPSGENAHFDVKILGDCLVLSSGRPVELRSTKSLGMFLALCLSPKGRLTRAQLTELLWDTSKDGSAAFRQGLKALRDSLKGYAPDLLSEAQGALQLNTASVRLDSNTLLDHLAATELPGDLLQSAEADTLMHGLDGLSLPFDQFLREERQRFRSKLVDGLRRIVEVSPERSEKRGRAARALLTTDPLDEFAVRHLMYWLWVRGEASAATKVFYEFSKALDDLGEDPSRETLDLLRKIKLDLDNPGGTTAPPAEAKAPAVDQSPVPGQGDLGRLLSPAKRPTIVVRPFVALGGERRVSELAIILTFDLIIRLSRFSMLDVIWRDTSYILDPESDDLASAASVGARYVASGTLRLFRDRLIMHVTLSDAEQQRILWAEKFDEQMDDLFAIEDQIEGTTAAAMAINISLAERNAARARDPSSLDAYSLVVSGRLEDFEDGASGRDATARAMRCFTAAIAHDREYSAALAGLARAHCVQWRFGWSANPQRSFDSAMKHALRAVEADPNDATAHAELGFVNLYAREHDRSMSAYERAMELNPSNCEIIASYADALSHNGEPERAIPLFERALKLNPLKPDLYLSDLAGSYFVMEEFEQAIDTIRKMRQPKTAQRCLTASLMLAGHEEEGRREASKLLAMDPNFSADAWVSVVPDRLPKHTRLFRLGLKRAGL